MAEEIRHKSSEQPKDKLLGSKQKVAGKARHDSPAPSLELEEQLVERCQKGEPGAFEDLVKAYSKRVFAICYRSAGHESEAQDLTQDVFLRVHQTLTSFRSAKGSFNSWLTRLTRNLLLEDRYRRARITDAPGDKPTSGNQGTAERARADSQPMALEAGNPIPGELHELPPELREMIFRDPRKKPITEREELAIANRYVEYKELAARAVEVFGNETEAGRWLSTQSPDFSGRTPLQDFIEAGPDRVLDTLGRIEHGVYF